MALTRNIALALTLAFVASVGLTACSPEVGRKEWCDDLKKKDKGEWTANEAKEFAKNCVF